MNEYQVSSESLPPRATTLGFFQDCLRFWDRKDQIVLVTVTFDDGSTVSLERVK